MPEKRNIVLITLDSLRADHCSFMGYSRNTTPTIDEMARRGLYFKNAITAEVGTPASMITIFTGKYSSVSPIITDPEPWREVLRNRKTLAQVLSRKGYSTGAFTPNAFVSSYFEFNKGFRHFHDFLHQNESVLGRLHTKMLDKIAKSGKTGPMFILRNILNLVQRNEIFKSWEDYYPLILEWIKNVDQPFFLWILAIDTHHPYLAPRKFRKWSNLVNMWYSNWKLKKVNWENKLSAREKQWLINAYDDSIRYADEFINQLWDDLRDLDPILIIHADHGEGFDEHGFYGHQPYLYDELIHVPLVIYNSDVKGKIEHPVSLRGLASTILELIRERNEFPSESFLQGRKDWVISVVFEKKKIKVAVRMKNWKFITGQKDKDELYYLKEDPYEQKNIIDKHPKLVKEMKNIVKLYIKCERIGQIRGIIPKLKDIK